MYTNIVLKGEISITLKLSCYHSPAHWKLIDVNVVWLLGWCYIMCLGLFPFCCTSAWFEHLGLFWAAVKFAMVIWNNDFKWLLNNLIFLFMLSCSQKSRVCAWIADPTGRFSEEKEQWANGPVESQRPAPKPTVACCWHKRDGADALNTCSTTKHSTYHVWKWGR